MFLWDDASSNTGLGRKALASNTTGERNTASGELALNKNTSGSSNTANGNHALSSNTTGFRNTAIGEAALLVNSSGSFNTASGGAALFFNTGSYNTAVGAEALGNNQTGSNNSANGFRALISNTTGDRNTGNGYKAGSNATTGSDNIFLGSGARGVVGEGNTIRIGGTAVGTGPEQQNRTLINGIRGVAVANPTVVLIDPATGQLGSDTATGVRIKGVFGVTTGVEDAIPVLIDSKGQLGTAPSSRRYKENIADMADSSYRILQLRPVTFRYRKGFEDGSKPIQFGLIAEEVAEVFPELVVYDEEGRPETVKYHLLSSLLLNELQKQASALAGLRAEVAELRETTAPLLPPRVAAMAHGTLVAQLETKSRSNRQ